MEYYKQVIANTPQELKGKSIKDLFGAVLIGRRKDKETQRTFTMYDYYITDNNKVLFVVEKRKIV